MATTMSVYEETSENLYEIVWNARLQFFKNNFDHLTEIQEALTVFRQTDLSYVWGIQRAELQTTVDAEPKLYFTGEVKVTPRHPETAKMLFSTAEEANKQQIDIILNHIQEDTDVIAELGAGYGGNLIRLAQAFHDKTGQSLSERNIKLFMAEYTQTGRDLCKEFLKRENAPEMDLQYIDHKAPDLSFISEAKNPLIITVHSIEQVPGLPSDYFKTLSAVAPNVRGLHLEPVGFQFEPDLPKWAAHEKFMKKQNWNENFAEVIKQAEKDGYITIDRVDTTFAAGQPENPTTLVTWHANS